jgi:serine/threonine-protein kinase RsbW
VAAVADRLCLALDSTLGEIETLSREFGQFAAANGLCAEVQFAVNLALEEIVTNVIDHGYDRRAGHRVWVEVRITPGELTASVEDSAPAFNPLEVALPDLSVPLERRKPGGLGILLASGLSDGLEYSRADGKNRLVFHKHLQPSKSS